MFFRVELVLLSIFESKQQENNVILEKTRCHRENLHVTTMIMGLPCQEGNFEITNLQHLPLITFRSYNSSGYGSHAGGYSYPIVPSGYYGSFNPYSTGDRRTAAHNYDPYRR